MHDTALTNSYNSNSNKMFSQLKQLIKANSTNINDNVQYETVKDLKLTADVVTSVDLNCIGSGSGTVNIEIDNELNLTSENPVQNKIITEAINSLSSNKLNKSDYVVDSALNETSTNPVENRAIRGLIYNIINRVSQLEFVNNIKLSYATDLEVFATRTPIVAGTTSEKIADVSRMFTNTNKWSSLSSYTEGAVVTDYITGTSSSTPEELMSQTVGIYKALTNVPAGTALTVDTYWKNLTDTYLERKPITETNVDGGEVEVQRYFHRYIEEVPAGAIQTLIIKSETGPTEQNLVIDWGDGTKTNLRSANDEFTDQNQLKCESDSNGFIYTCTHDYTNNIVNKDGEPIESKYFTIEIVGNKFSILTSGENNIISSIFGNNMQFYLNCIDVEGLLKGSRKLLYVSCADYNSAITSIRNAKSMFEDCVNLQYAIGFYELTGINTMLSMERMFAGCRNMLNCDCRIAKSVAAKDDNGNTAVYLDCANMASRLRALLPTNGFDSPFVTLDSTFKNCKSIYASSKDETGEQSDEDIINIILFKDTTKTFSHNETFTGCNLINSIGGFVPDSWK